MSSTGTILRATAELLNFYGLHTGKHFASTTGRLDVCAAAFRAVTGKLPNCFLDDDANALLLIETCEPAMDAIRWISTVLATQPPTDEGAIQPNHIEHVTHWASTVAPGELYLPSHSEVIGCILRAAQAADTLTDIPAQRTAA